MSVRTFALVLIEPALVTHDETTFNVTGLVSVPVLLVIAAACGILIVLVVDLLRLRRESRLTALHTVASVMLAAAVVSLAAVFAAGIATVPAARADTVGNGIADVSPDAVQDPLLGVQLPTLPAE
ncbi:hypothetical protein FVA74_07390 [Salinibacterium sp. dk2585]|uniref:hypothetical protein n=1 Tax=unclassified Salinibacterium TaxID=2632331 RepID=UPI0011C246BF|nr:MULTISPECIES: hypothetical protein [unclassified Salinibacterium]QEE61419.1 hypothetical protein FVA74_07390 [Salinibacterium sp. dk2585]TXK54096.1 hypothetical protein FVP63_08840 [Salinibacterium sp. dk5596]